jgi:hypothetical protein
VLLRGRHADQTGVMMLRCVRTSWRTHGTSRTAYGRLHARGTHDRRGPCLLLLRKGLLLPTRSSKDCTRPASASSKEAIQAAAIRRSSSRPTPSRA